MSVEGVASTTNPNCEKPDELMIDTNSNMKQHSKQGGKYHFAMTPAHLKFNNTSYMDSVKDTAADTELISGTNQDGSILNPDSPARYGSKKKHAMNSSIFKSGHKIIEHDQRMTRINEFQESQIGGKNYLRKRTLEKGCPRLVKMV